MPTLDFKGKPSVYSHHLSVPFRELVPDAGKSHPPAPDGDPGKVGETTLDGNLIIHGDNLEALKALLPRYAGKVDVIYIDPPYNTGNEGWAYNDNVNSPLMKAWLGEVVDKDDLERHDKWLCMMWPRLQLMRELLSQKGSIWITLDDNEYHHAKAILDEIFDETNFLANISWEKRYTRSNNAKKFYSLIDRILVYRKSEELTTIDESRNEKSDSNYANPDNDPRGEWTTSSYVNPATKDKRRNLVYEIERPDGGTVEHPTHAWKYSIQEHKRHINENLLWWGRNHDAKFPRLKSFLKHAPRLVPIDLWRHDETGTTDEAGGEIKDIFGSFIFETPKPTRLLQRILNLINNSEALVLDSFAGSGTTAHAVLAANKRDGGNRKFILVETEDYADSLTAERVRRVIDGVPGAKDEALRDGLGGGFTYAELGEPLDLERFFSGGAAGAPPSYEQVARYVAYTATGATIDAPVTPRDDWFIGEAGGYRMHLVYKPDLAFMRSPEAALDAGTLEAIKQSNTHGKPVLVYAAAKYMSQTALTGDGVTFCQLPWSIYNLIGSGADV